MAHDRDANATLIGALLAREAGPCAVIDPQGRVQHANDQARAVLGEAPFAPDALGDLATAQATAPLDLPGPDPRSRWRVERLVEGPPALLLARLCDGGWLDRSELAELVRSAKVGVSVIRFPDLADPESMRIELNNPAASEASRADLSDMPGRRFLEAFPAVRASPLPELYAQVLQSGEAVELPQLVYGDGKVPEAVFQVSLAPLGRDLVLGQYVNVTEAERARLAFRQLFDFAPLPLLRVGLLPLLQLDPLSAGDPTAVAQALRGSEVVDLNVAARAMLGPGQDSLDLGALFLPDGLSALQGLHAALAEGREGVQLAATLRTPTGGTRDTWLSVHQVDADRGELILAFTDISALRATQRELERSNRDLARFAHTASHDLRSPLAAVMGLAELLQAAFGEAMEPQALTIVERIGLTAQRMHRLVEDLLTYAEVGAGPTRLRPLDLGRPLETALGNLQLELERTGARVRVGPLPRVEGDELHLSQVFQNLIGNALKYRSEAPPVVEIDARTLQGRVLVEVRDNGIGFDPDQAERVLLPFERLEHAAPIEGSGLGLAVVQRVIELHGGEIRLDSAPGKGTRVELTLPVAQR